MNKIAFFVSLLIFAGSAAYPAETGKPFITLYPSIRTGGHNSNWAFVQDNRGVMYIGNGYGIQEFDGSSWRLIRISNGSFVRSFAKDSSGCIFVGSATELGYLDADNNGNMQYISLFDQIPTEDRGFNYIWSTHATREGIYFQARERIFRFQRRTSAIRDKDAWQIKIWRPDNSNNYFIYSFYLDQNLFIHQRGTGLMKMVGDSLMLIPGSQQFAYDRIHVMLPFPGRPATYLLGTFNRGLFLFDGNSFQPFHTDADSVLQGSTLYDGKVLPDGSFALGTLSKGFLIIGNTGKLILHLTKTSGLLSNTVPSVFIDQQQNVWLGMVGGIGIIEYESSLSQFLIASGSTPIDLNRHQGTLYVSATDGIYYLNKEDSQFKYVSGMMHSGSSNSLAIDDHLYVANVTGVYLIHDKEGSLALPYDAATPSFICLHRSRFDSSRIFAGALIGLAILRYDENNPGRLRLETIVPGLHEYIRQIIEPQIGTLWLSTYNAGVIRLHFADNDIAKPVIERFGPEYGLPTGITSVFQVADRLLFGTSKGIFQFNEEQQRFQPDAFFEDLSLGINPGECMIVTDTDSNIWANAGKETAFYQKIADGSYRLEKGLISRFSDESVNAIYPEKDSTVWFGTSSGVIRFTAGKKKMPRALFPALIRCVKFANDSILYYGGSGSAYKSSIDEQIPFRLNSIAFEFAAPSYIKPAANEFKIKLEGFDKSWSPWSRDSKRNYTNLHHGRYAFRVKARNIYGQESSEASFFFNILAPWYARWWAYLAYILCGGVALFGLVRLRTRKLRERSHLLEQVVQKRTEEIRQQADELETLDEIVSLINRELELDRVFNSLLLQAKKLQPKADIVVLLILDHNLECFKFTAVVGDDFNQVKDITFSQQEILDRFSRGAEEVEKNIHIIREFQDIDGNEKLKLVATPKSLMVMVIALHGKLEGLLVLENLSTVGAFDRADAKRLLRFRSHAISAIAKAKMLLELQEKNAEIIRTQEQLITQQKLASLGALTAGIAHEIKNPLNFVNNFAELSIELVDELQQLLHQEKKNLESGRLAEIEETVTTLKQNAARIQEHGKRADSIVRSMLQHSRGKAGERQLTDINALLEEDINLAYHGMRAQDSSFNIKIEKDLDQSIGKLEVVPQDISRVFLNIINNGCYAAHRKKMDQSGDLSPTLSVRTRNMVNTVEIRIRDNGNGIPESVRDKLFAPFFTTKPAGHGTGLGLSISYDIVVHGHNGQITFETVEGEFAEFIISLPKIGLYEKKNHN